jgi:hypothetical protein
VHKRLLTATTDSRSFKCTIKKTVNPNTGKSSTIEIEFSAHNWNARTLRHLKDIQVLGKERFKQVFDMAFNSKRGRSRAVTEPINNSDDDLHSDGTLHSEDSDNVSEGGGDKGGNEETAHDVGDTMVQSHEDGESCSDLYNVEWLKFLRLLLRRCR